MKERKKERSEILLLCDFSNVAPSCSFDGNIHLFCLSSESSCFCPFPNFVTFALILFFFSLSSPLCTESSLLSTFFVFSYFLCSYILFLYHFLLLFFICFYFSVTSHIPCVSRHFIFHPLRFESSCLRCHAARRYLGVTRNRPCIPNP